MILYLILALRSLAQLPWFVFILFTEGVLQESVVHVLMVIALEKKKVKSKQYTWIELIVFKELNSDVKLKGGTQYNWILTYLNLKEWLLCSLA